MELSKNTLIKLELQKLPIFKNSDIINILKKYTDEYILQDWINIEYLDKESLCLNPMLNKECYELLMKNEEEINWNFLSENPSNYAIKILKENEEKINGNYLARNINSKAINILEKKLNENNNYLNEFGWNNLSLNPNTKAINLLKKYESKINWKRLSENPNKHAIEILKKNKEKVDILGLTRNTNPDATRLLLKNIRDVTELGWQMLSMNPNEIVYDIIKNNKDKVNWNRTSLNTNKKVLEILNKEFPDRIVWNWISGNKSAIGILKKNKKKIWTSELCGNENPKALKILFELVETDDIDWETLSSNPVIFKKVNVLKLNSKGNAKTKSDSKSKSKLNSNSDSKSWKPVYDKNSDFEKFNKRLDEMNTLIEFNEKKLKPVSKMIKTKPKSI